MPKSSRIRIWTIETGIHILQCDDHIHKLIVDSMTVLAEENKQYIAEDTTLAPPLFQTSSVKYNDARTTRWQNLVTNDSHDHCELQVLKKIESCQRSWECTPPRPTTCTHTRTHTRTHTHTHALKPNLGHHTPHLHKPRRNYHDSQYKHLNPRILNTLASTYQNRPPFFLLLKRTYKIPTCEETTGLDPGFRHVASETPFGGEAWRLLTSPVVVDKSPLRVIEWVIVWVRDRSDGSETEEESSSTFYFPVAPWCRNRPPFWYIHSGCWASLWRWALTWIRIMDTAQSMSDVRRGRNYALGLVSWG